MSMIIDDFFDVIAIFNVVFAIWGVYGWSRLFRINHTNFRYLYSLWIFISLVFGALYVGIILTTSPGMLIRSGASIFMIILRPAVGFVLGASAVTAEVMYTQRLMAIQRRNGNDNS